MNFWTAAVRAVESLGGDSGWFMRVAHACHTYGNDAGIIIPECRSGRIRDKVTAPEVAVAARQLP